MSKLKVRLTLKDGYPVMKYGNYTISEEDVGFLSKTKSYILSFGIRNDIILRSGKFADVYNVILEKKGERKYKIKDNPDQLSLL